MSKILFVISPTINSFTDKDKGSKANRINCAYSHLKNSVTSNIQIISAAGIATAIGHFKPVTKLEKPIPYNLSKLTLENIKETGKKLFNDFNAAPKYIKIAAITAMSLSLINRTFKKIEIDRKYTNRAILEEAKKDRDAKQINPTPIKSSQPIR